MIRLIVAIALALFAVVAYPVATLPTLPQATVDTTYSYPTGGTCTASNSSEFTSCLNSAALNSVIVLNAGTTYSAPLGGFVFPNKTTGSGWIYVVSSQLASLPGPGTRVSSSNASLMPKIVASTANETAIQFALSSHHYRLVGVEISPASGSFNYNIVQLGGGNYAPYPSNSAQMPHHIIFDRVYVHGDPTQGARRGINLEGNNVAVIESYFNQIWDNGQYSCCGPADSQAIAAWTSYGPFKIHNNYLEAAGENILFGGVDTGITNLVPADITITRNYFYKQPAWASASPPKQVKNLLELKNGHRVLIEGNVLENNYPVAQNGMGVLFTVRNQSGGNTWADVSDVTFRYNKLLNSYQGINIAGMDTEAGPSQRSYRIHIHNNFIQLTSGGICLLAQNQTSDIILDHNYFQNCSTPGYVVSPSIKLDHFTYTNNLAWDGGNGFVGESCGVGTSGLACHTTDYTFTKNAIINYQGGTYPAGNYYPASNAAVQFVNYSGGNYRLASGSPYKAQGTDGKDLGPDWDAMDAAIAGTGATYTVTPSAGANGSISPSTPQTVSSGGTIGFTVTPNAGYTASVSGCGGSLSGTTYTTGAIASNCSVSATFCKKLSVPASLVATGLTPNPPSNATISFDWADVNSHTDSSALSGDLANYRLHWGTTSGGPYNTASSATSSISVGPTQANITYYARVGAESSLNAVCNSDLSSEISFYADTVPPSLSGLGPSGSLAKDTTSATLSATTSESATCRYGDNGVSWSSRTPFSTTGSTSHSSSIPVWAGLVKRVCTLCRDALGNESADGCTSFSVNAKPKRGQVN